MPGANDAAIACALVQGVVDPQMSGLGGFGHMQVYMPDWGVHEVLKFYARAGSAVTKDMWLPLMSGQSRDGFAFLLDDHRFDAPSEIFTPKEMEIIFWARQKVAAYRWF